MRRKGFLKGFCKGSAVVWGLGYLVGSCFVLFGVFGSGRLRNCIPTTFLRNYLATYLFIYRSFYLSVHLSTCLTVYLSICVCAYLSACLPIYLYLSLYLSLSLSLCFSLSLSICLCGSNAGTYNPTDTDPWTLFSGYDMNQPWNRDFLRTHYSPNPCIKPKLKTLKPLTRWEFPKIGLP